MLKFDPSASNYLIWISASTNAKHLLKFKISNYFLVSIPFSSSTSPYPLRTSPPLFLTLICVTLKQWTELHMYPSDDTILKTDMSAACVSTWQLQVSMETARERHDMQSIADILIYVTHRLQVLRYQYLIPVNKYVFYCYCFVYFDCFNIF
jgi:hypothetical protein